MELSELLGCAERSGQSAVLATVVAVEGHAYRKEGAAMVLLASGESFGIVSPGCLEDDLAARVPGVLATGLPELVEYDMRPEEDPIWGEAIGCGGIISVLLEPLRDELLRHLRRARRYADRGIGTTLSRVREGEGLTYRLRSIDPLNAGGKARAARVAGGLSLQSDNGANLLHETVFRPRPRLILFGAGRDAPPLCELAAKIGFRVVVADWRERYLSAARFPGAAELTLGAPDRLAAELAPASGDYAVVCSHHMRRDREMLELLLQAEPAYIGVMGSGKRIALLFEGLRRTANVHAPVGLAIGADGPQEIAVSIVAELIARRAELNNGVPARKGERIGADRRLVFGGGQGEPDGRAQAVR